MNMDLPPEEIVEQVLAGDVDAFAWIVERYQRDLYRIAARALGDRAATEDLVQQAFVNAYAGLGGFRRGADFGAWLRTIARNAVRNELRRSQREGHRLRRYHRYLERQLDDRARTEQEQAQLLQLLQRCREDLSEPAGHALALRYEQGLSFPEIAEDLGRTIAATRQLLSRVRIALRRCTEQHRSHHA